MLFPLFYFLSLGQSQPLLLTSYLALRWPGALILAEKPSLARLLLPPRPQVVLLSLQSTPDVTKLCFAGAPSRFNTFAHVFPGFYISSRSFKRSIGHLPCKDCWAGLFPPPSITTPPTPPPESGCASTVTTWASLLFLSLHPLCWWVVTSLYTCLPAALPAQGPHLCL